jgi:tetratricopeptide (TPR) repeat protein
MADPASMALESRTSAPPATSTTFSFWPWSKSTAATPTPPVAPPVQPVSPWPSQQISMWKHPIKYFEASVAEMPVGFKAKSATHPVMEPAASNVSAVASTTNPTAPPTPEFFIFAAQTCERQGDVPQARQNLQRALTMWPGNAEVLRAAARMEDRQSNLPLAENLYRQAVASNPQSAAALNDLGLCLAREGRLEPSLQTLEQAIHLQPDKPLYRNNAATVLVEMHQDQQALAHLSAVHSPADANFNLGQLLVERGRAADAAPYFQTALQLNPGMQQAQEALAKLQGNQFAASAPVAPGSTSPQQVAPAGPSFAPQQQTWQSGPQLSYPATARTPAADASTYVPPQYMPPVASYPGVMQR